MLDTQSAIQEFCRSVRSADRGLEREFWTQQYRETWLWRAKATACLGRYLLTTLQSQGKECGLIKDDFTLLGQFFISEDSCPSFFVFNNRLDHAPSHMFEMFELYTKLSVLDTSLSTDSKEDVLQDIAIVQKLLQLQISNNYPHVQDLQLNKLYYRLRHMPLPFQLRAWDLASVDELRTHALAALERKKGKSAVRAERASDSGFIYLDVSNVLDIHYSLAAYFADAGDPIAPEGMRSLALLESAIERPRTGTAGYEKYQTIHRKAGALLHSLICNHPFHNGNKRTALAATIMFLNRNKQTLDVEDELLFEFLVKIAAGDLTENDRDSDALVEAIARFIRDHCLPIRETKNIGLSQFLDICTTRGCKVAMKKDGSKYVVKKGVRRINVPTCNELEGKVARSYIQKLGISEAYSGIRNDSIGTSPASIIAQYQRVMLQLAAY